MESPNSHVRAIVLVWWPEDELYEPALNLLEEKSRPGVTRFHRKEDQWRSLLGRHLNTYVLREQGAQGELRFGRMPKGKPYLVHPVMDPPILTNLSHDNSCVAIGYSRPPGGEKHQIGVDVMKIAIRSDETPRMFANMLSDQLTMGERASLKELMSGEQLVERAIILWSIKEAFVKATGDGMSFDISKIDCRLDQGEVWVHGKPAPEWEFRLWAVNITNGPKGNERYAMVTCEWVGEGGRVIFEDGSTSRLQIMMMDDFMRRIGLPAAERKDDIKVTIGRLHWLI